MGRPLSKKFIGNRNIGTTGTGDNYGIGGEGVASVTANTVGSYTTALPTATFSTPNIPGGVRTTGIVHGNALSASTTSNGTGYNFGDTLTVVGGTSTSAATFTVASTVIVAAVKSAGGSGYADGDVLTFSTGFSPTLTLRVNRPGGGTGSPDNFTITQAGRRTSANPTNPVSADSRTGSGSGCTVTLTFGVYSFSTVVTQGDYTVIPSSPVSFTGGGTGTAATVPFGVSGIVITEKGSGYTSVADAAITFSGGAAAATPVLTTTTGQQYAGDNIATGGGRNVTTYQENAILIYAKTTSGGTSQIGDIVSQKGRSTFKVITADGTADCLLKASAVSAAGECTITATDSDGDTYYVTKISSHRCTITRGTGTQFVTGQSVPWTFGSAVEDVSVKIPNA